MPGEVSRSKLVSNRAGEQAVIAISGAAHAHFSAPERRDRPELVRIGLGMPADLGGRVSKRNRSMLFVLPGDSRLPLHPVDQFVELDRLLGGDEAVGDRKSTFAGGFSRLAGGRG